MLKAIYATFWLFLWVSWTGTSSMVNALEIVPPPTMSRPKSSCWCLPTPHLPSELLGSGGLLINGLKSNPPLSFASLQELLGGLGCVCANPIWQNHTLTDLALNYTSCVDWQTEGNGLWLVRVNGSRCLTSLMMPKLWLISAGREVMNMVSILPGPIVRILRDSGNLFSGLLETWIVALLTLSRDLLATLIGLLETLYIHYSVASLWGAFYVLTSHPRRFIMTGMLTAFICWAKEVTFSRLLLNWYMVPMKIMTLSLTLMMKILSNLMGRIWKMIRVPVDVCERLLDAWPRTRISAIPPKGVIVRFEDDFGHVGFGSCIRVACLKGIYCWVPKHVLDYSTTIRGPKGSMSVTLMRPFYEDFTGDSILLRGPDNWNSNLGLKPADVLPITRARRGSTKFYIEREVKEGQGFTWFCQTADLYEMYKGFIRVGVESEPGDSGLPYFSGNKIVAMHVGAYGDINENKATFLVEIPGITGPAYLVESAHTETRLLTLAEDIAEGEELLARVVKIAGTNYQVSLNNTVQKRLGLAYKPKGRHWGDVSDDEDDDSYKDDILRTFGALEKTYDRKSRSEPPKFESENFRTLEEKNGTNDVRPDPTKPEDLKLKAPVHLRENKGGVDAGECGYSRTAGESSGNQERRSRERQDAKAVPEPSFRSSRQRQKWKGQRRKRGPAWDDLPSEGPIDICGPITKAVPKCQEKPAKEGKETGGQARKAKKQNCHQCPNSPGSEGSPQVERQGEEENGRRGEEAKAGQESPDSQEGWFTRLCGGGTDGGRCDYQRNLQGRKTSIEGLFPEFYKWSERMSQGRHGEAPPGFAWVGYCQAFYYPPHDKGLSSFGKQLMEQHAWLSEICKDFGWPQFGASAEFRSLTLQAERRIKAINSAEIPPLKKRLAVMADCAKRYWGVRMLCPNWARNGLDKVAGWSEFLDSVHSLEPTAGSGVPYAMWSGRKTHEDWVGERGSLVEIWDLVWTRLNRMEDYCFSTAEQAVKDGICDPIRLFVKGEPHKVVKLKEGRYRLIASVSLVDQLIARMLFGFQNKRELRCYREIPSCPGMGLSTDDQVLEFVTRLADKVGVDPQDLVENYQDYIVPTDCSGFDWSVPEWLLEDDLEVRNVLTQQLSPTMFKLRKTWLKCLNNSVFCLSDGSLLAQTIPGVQKSGSYNTSSSNSRMRVMLSQYAGAEWCFAMGDDAIESISTDLSVYQTLGIKCEKAEKFDFCSHIFVEPSVAVPVNVGKMLYGVLCGHHPDSVSDADKLKYYESAMAVANELRHLPEGLYLKILRALDLVS
nr:replicase protein [raspberry enamovirus 1]